VTHSIKHTGITVVAILTLFSMVAVAQKKSEISIEGAGFFTKDVAVGVFDPALNGVVGTSQHATNSGGLLLGYRHNIIRWLAAEVNYGYARNTQEFQAIFTGTCFLICPGYPPGNTQYDIHQFTGSAIIKLPSFAKLRPYALGGVGAFLFAPMGCCSGGIDTKRVFVYGGGFEYAVTKLLSLRAEYRGYVYKTVILNAWTNTAAPSAGLAFHF
jgi:opacity protein-like surface antigen